MRLPFVFYHERKLEAPLLTQVILGCRAGDGCPYAHVEEQAIEAGPSKAPQPRAKVARSQSAQQPQRTYQAPAVDSSRVVQRPRPQSEDPRTFQLGQIQRRFKPEVFENDDASTMTFKMPPSDPDFPYEIEALECSLLVPKSYPETEKPSLRVLNKDIPRGFQINIERGFDIILSTAPEATLLGVMNRLDRQLESILTGEMAETIKIIAHRGAPPASNTAQKANEGEIAVQTATTTKLLQPPLPTFSSQQRWDAQAKRQTNVRQLEARFGRLQSFHKAPDGFSYTLPLDSPKRSAWPAPLQNIRSFTLLLPELYPLEPSTIMLGNDSAEARNVEQAFNARSAAGLDATLTQQVNYLTQHVKDFATEAPLPVPEKAVKSTEPATTVPTAEETSHTPLQAKPLADEDDRSHIKVIPRPPEWAAGGEQGGSDSDSEDYSYDSGDETEDSVHTDNGTQPASAPAERGILLSFPHLELHGIELMEVTTLNITVKCERCKDTTDIERLRNNAQGDASGMREHSCKKCANPLAVGFRADLIHGNSVRAGYLDLDGCTVIDMLPRYECESQLTRFFKLLTLLACSNFIPTCAECSTSHPAPGVVSVRGESTMAICRECHKRMSMHDTSTGLKRVLLTLLRLQDPRGQVPAS